MTKFLRASLFISLFLLAATPILAESSLRPSLENIKSTLKPTLEAIREEVKSQQEQIKEEVQETKGAVFTKIQSRFLEHIDKIIHHLEELKSQIAKTPGLDESERAQGIEIIDQIIKDLQTLKGKVQETTTLGELREIQPTVLTAWRRVRAIHNQRVGQVLIGRFENFLERLNKLADRLELRIKDLQEQGMDISQTQGKLNDFREIIKEAKAKIAQAEKLFKNGQYQEAIGLLRESKQKLHQAGQELRQAILKTQEALKEGESNS